MNSPHLISTLCLALFTLTCISCASKKEEPCPEQSERVSQLKTEFDTAIAQRDTATARAKISAIAQVCQRYDTDLMQHQLEALKSDSKNTKKPVAAPKPDNPKNPDGWPESPEVPTDPSKIGNER